MGVFISYSSKDRDFVLSLAEDLRRAGLTVWLDVWDVQGRAPYWDEIQGGIEGQSHFLFAISPDSLAQNSGALKELYHAVQPQLDKIIVPVLVKPISIPFERLPIPISAGRLHIHNFVTGDYADMLARVIRALNAPTPAVSGSSGQYSQASASTPPVGTRTGTSGQSRRWFLALGGVVVLIAAVLAGIALTANGRLGTSTTAALTPTTAATTAVPTVAVAQNPTLPNNTPTDTSTVTVTATALSTDTPAPTPVPLSATDVERTVQAEIILLETEGAQTAQANATGTAADLTMTATLFTKTPTPDIRASALARQALTQTAMVTATYTPSHTPTPSYTLGISSTPNTTPIPRVRANRDWMPPPPDLFDGVEMVLVPSGCFLMGSEFGSSDNKPAHPVCFSAPFYIDRFEVTNGQFRRLAGQVGRSSNWTGDNRPREKITWFEAQAFCEKRGARLPTEAEWEYAARGPDNLIYPWGKTYEKGRANVNEKTSGINGGSFLGQTTDVGAYSSGKSWVDAYDLSGNVREWTITVYDQKKFPYPYQSSDGRNNNIITDSVRVLRGGSWDTAVGVAGAAFRSGWSPNNEFNFLGFRCARSLP